MVNVVHWLLTGELMTRADWLGPKVDGHLALLLHSSHEPGELSQCSKHDDSTIDIVLGIIIIVTKSTQINKQA